MIYYTIYKVTNLINGKYYIGKHQTESLNDGYPGSGIRLKYARKKYGNQNFIYEILHIYDEEWKMNLAERILVVPDSETNYNIARGGQGGCIVLYSGHEKYDETRRKISESKKLSVSKMSEQERKERFNRGLEKRIGQKRSLETRQRMSESNKKVDRSYLINRPVSKETREKLKQLHLGKKRTDEQIKRISDNHADMSGKNNPMFGKLQTTEARNKISLSHIKKEKIECPHCKKLTNAGNFGRWHGDKCKNKMI